MKHLDKLVKKIVARKENYRCYVCGTEGHDLAHLFVRNKLATRWDTDSDGNCHILCRECHTRDHNGEEIYAEAYIEKNGLEAYGALRRRSNEMLTNVKAFIEETQRRLGDESNSY